MFNRLLARLFPAKPATRALDAAGGGRRWSDAPALVNASTVHTQALTIAQRAAHFVTNNPHGTRAVEGLKANLIGAGIKPRPQHPSAAVRKRLTDAFNAWTDAADCDGLTDFYGLQQALVFDLATFGENLFIWASNPATGAPQLRRLHPEQLDRSLTKPLPGGAMILQGVEIDASGARTAYHIRPMMTADPRLSLILQPQRFPASEVIHVFRPSMPGQVRGLSWFAPVLLPAKELDALADALLVRAKVAALHAGFIIDSSGESPYAGDQQGSTLDASLEPGVLLTLPQGKTVEFPNLPDQGGASGLMAYSLRMMAAGAGLTYEQLTGDYSNTNYSSDRAAKLEFQRWAEAIQHQIIVFQFCRKVWDRFVRYQALAGTIPASTYLSNPGAFAGKWHPPAWPWVDPTSEVSAFETLLKNRLASRSEIIAERGYDAEEVDAEIAADDARLKALGLSTPDALPAARELPMTHTLFRADFRPATVNETARTVELIASTGAGVVRQDLAGPFIEVLDMSPGAVDLHRLEGMPLLDSHRQDSLDRVLGVVRSARLDGGALLVTVEISPRAEAYWADIKAGIIRNVSVGYGPMTWRDGTDAAGNRLRTITKWELREVSLVPVPADPSAKIRETEGTKHV